MRFALQSAVKLAVSVSLFAAAGARAEDGAVVAANLRCEYLTNPLAVDVAKPRLSWEVSAAQAGAKNLSQSAYRVIVGTTPEEVAKEKGSLWDSGKIASDSAMHIEYQGAAVKARSRAYWRVRLWDQAGKASAWSETSSWAVGLPTDADWGGAKWIGDATPAPEVRKANNGYHSALSPTADAAKWVMIELREKSVVDGINLFPARPFDWSADVPGLMFPLRYMVEVGDKPDLSDAAVVVDKTSDDALNPGTEVVKLACKPTAGRFVRLTVTKLRDRDPKNFAFALAEMQVLSGGKIASGGAGVTSLDSIENAYWGSSRLVDGDVASHGGSGFEPLPSPTVRADFAIAESAKIVRATAYATALGLYELRINGSKVGDHVLAPEWTDYAKRVQYQAYDVTPLVKAGKNAIGAHLGDGWYAGEIGLIGADPQKRPRAIYGRLPSLLVRLDVELADGTTKTIVSDGSWKGTLGGPITMGDLLDGDRYDARKEMPGWDKPGFNDAAWKPVRVREAPRGVAVETQPNEPIRVTRDLKAMKVSEPKPGVYVFDLGQNMVGWCRVKVSGEAGTTLTLRHAEVTNQDGTIYTTNLRGAEQKDQYTLKGGGEEVWEPRFTYHGFRFVEVTGLKSAPTLDMVTGRVLHSAPPEVGTFECSDPMVNRLWQNIIWTQRANMHSTPTDCPQRDERCGWMGDILAFAPTACFNMDMGAFFTKWLRDTRDAQAADGRFGDISPNPYDSNARFSGVPAWGDAGVFVPWVAYQYYGDKRILEEQYDACVRWVEFIRGKNPDLLWKNSRGNDYGDWLNADTLKLPGWPAKGAEMPKEVFATAFFAESTRLVGEMARVLGKTEDAAKYAELAKAIRGAFVKAYITPEGILQGDTQAGYAIALQFGLIPQEMHAKTVERMVARFEPYGGQISTGFHSTVPLMTQLSANGKNAEAYRLLLNRKMPSWGYAIDHGATTIWERWDGYVEGRGFQDPGMNSFAHYAIGSVGEWMYGTVLGITSAEPGFGRVVIKPRPGPGIEWAKGTYRSIRGPIEVSWDTRKGTAAMRVVIPPNMRATVHAPSAAGERVVEVGSGAYEWSGAH